MLKRLADQGLVEHTRYYGARLTELGRDNAVRTIRRHRILELFLVQVLGYTWDRVHEEAERLEHVASEEMIDRMAKVLGEPIEDPHGLSRKLIDAAGDMQILRAKGFLAVDNKPMRLAVQGVGPRVDSYFDRPLRDDEKGGGHLVIIGLRGMDREAIAARLGGVLA